MKYGKIEKTDILDGQGVRVSLYVSGCRNHCKGCHNAVACNFNYGNEYTQETKEEILNEVGKEYISGLSLLGGEPFEQENQEECYKLAKEVKEKYNKSVWCWTGYKYKDLIKGGEKYIDGITNNLLENIDVLVEGEFILDKRDISPSNLWRGSTNQRVIDLNETRRTKKLSFLKDVPNSKGDKYE